MLQVYSFVCFCTRFNPQQLSPTTAGMEMILASVNEEEGVAEYFYLAIDTPSDGLKDNAGRMMGYITLSTKGDFIKVDTNIHAKITRYSTF